MVEKGTDSNHVRENNAAKDPSRSTNWLANAKWYVGMVPFIVFSF